MENVPTVTLANYLNNPTSAEALADCKAILHSFETTSALIIRDPRVSTAENDLFLNTMEAYYDQPTELKMKDVRPEFSYQVGATPENTEKPRDHADTVGKLDNKPHDSTGADPKWRFFWRAGERPPKTEFPELNMPQVIPEKFPEWEKIMNRWASLMLQAVETVAEMIAVALEVPKDTFTRLLKYGPHLLAPTGSDLNKYNKVGTVMAGFHYDLNFMTIHGKSRFPGLFVWLRDGSKIPVRVPEGCLLLQAGKQMEWLTGGHITAGFHEVVVTEDTMKAVERAKQEGRPAWRVSTTLFSHVASDNTLEPLKAEWNTDEAKTKYPPTKAGYQVQEELKAINLSGQVM